jgi:membrane-bound lytic murein transglycosylase B
LIGLTLAALAWPDAWAKTRSAEPPAKSAAAGEVVRVPASQGPGKTKAKAGAKADTTRKGASPRDVPAKDAVTKGLAPEDAKTGETSDDKARVRSTPPSGPRLGRGEIAPLIDRTADQFGVERALVHAVVAAESAYNPGAVSHAGAVGLMQVMPATASDYGVGSAEALFDPKTNIRTGVRHLKRLLDKYGNDYGRAIMAYNAGEGVVDRTNNNVTYAETLDYTEAVIRHYRGKGGTQPTDEAVRKVGTLRRMSYSGKARRLLKRYLDPSLLSLKVRPTLSLESLNPSLHRVGPESKPMFELRPLPN